MRLTITALVVLALASSSCSSERDNAGSPPSTRLAEPADAIGQDLMLALSQAKNYHHKAKIEMSDGRTDDAIASVRAILSLRFPANAPEADDVRDDARALLAKLLVGKGELDEAARVVQEGIAASPRDSFFVANLYTVAGEIHEARAKLLDAAAEGDAKQRTVAERHAAIEAFDKSNQIDAVLQKQIMEQR
jgi:tetratricopeptide (TPR) repeat protein